MIDFDKAVRDPSDAERLMPAYNSGAWDTPEPCRLPTNGKCGRCVAALQGRLHDRTTPPPAHSRLPTASHGWALDRVSLPHTGFDQRNAPPCAGPLIRFDGHRARTDQRGTATVQLRQRRARTYTALASTTRLAAVSVGVHARRLELEHLRGTRRWA